MENKTPLISVLLPAYNADKYLSKAIESILNQTFPHFELIIIDDCSSDNTWNIIRKYADKDKRIVAVHNRKNLKLSGALNKGIALARGTYIARMDADDWTYPERFSKQYKFMEKHKDVGICGAYMEVCDSNLCVQGVRKYAYSDKEIRENIFFYSPFCHPVVMIRKEALELVGGYDGAFNPAEDYELYFRIGEKYKFANIRKILLKYRVVEKSMTTGSTKKMELMTHTIRKKYAKSYKMTTIQKMYDVLHISSLFLIPASLRIKIFSLIRDSKKKTSL